MVIKCCNGCVAPKRHRACWDHCPEYLAESEERNRLKEAEYRKRKSITISISNELTE